MLNAVLSSVLLIEETNLAFNLFKAVSVEYP